VLDIGSGLSCVVGLLAAHVQRLQSGEGRLVSTSLFEFALASLSTVAAEYFASGVVPGLLGTTRRRSHRTKVSNVRRLDRARRGGLRRPVQRACTVLARGS